MGLGDMVISPCGKYHHVRDSYRRCSVSRPFIMFLEYEGSKVWNTTNSNTSAGTLKREIKTLEKLWRTGPRLLSID